MSAWAETLNRWISLMMQLAAMLATCGLAWSGVQIILEASVNDNPHIVPSVLYRIVGIIAALFVIFQAPTLVAELRNALTTPLVP